VDAPSRETVEHAQQWLQEMDDRIQVHQLRQFLQTSSVVDGDGLIALVQHFLGKKAHTDAARDKIDFLLVQYFSQKAPSELDDNGADIAYVAQELEPVLGKVELKTPVWLNALDLALVAFTRFGYLMRRAFFRLMLADLNNILDGLTELEEKGVETIDCRRAQFSAQEPIVRLRMICQSWKVMFQAEYSSGQPLRMLVDLRASVDFALGRGAEAEGGEKAAAATAAAKAAPAKPAAQKGATNKSESSPPLANKTVAGKPALNKPVARAAGAAAGVAKAAAPAKAAPAVAAKPNAKFAVTNEAAPEFEVSAAVPEWNAEEGPQPGKKK